MSISVWPLDSQHPILSDASAMFLEEVRRLSIDLFASRGEILNVLWIDETEQLMRELERQSLYPLH